jgi:serine/threonine-protein kinase
MASEPSGSGGRPPQRIGKYEVVAHIATGGMGAVYKAVDTVLGRPVALKILPPELAAIPRMIERFQREARSAGKLSHENIVTLYECGRDRGMYFLALEFVDGIDLHEHLTRKKKLDPEEARQLLIQAARALAHVHKRGIVHRDIKPSNFLLTFKEGRPLLKLTDLGLAREDRPEEHRVTRAGTTVGTLDYMSPEQARDSSAADIRSDIYSLGCTAYHLLAGVPPFPEGTATERIFKHMSVDPPNLRTVNPAVPEALVAVIRRMMEKKPADRYQTPAELLRELQGFEATPQTSLDRNVLANLAHAAEEAPRPPKTPRSVPRRETPEKKSAPLRSPPPSPVRPRGEAVKGPEARASSQVRRFRDDNLEAATEKPTEEATTSAATSSWPEWWPYAAAGVGGALVLILALFLFGPGGTPSRTEGDGGRASGSKDGTAPKGQHRPGGPGPNDGGPDEAELPGFYHPKVPVNPVQLRQHFTGMLAFPTRTAEAIILRVSRDVSDAKAFRSLAEAWASAPAGKQTVIEIHDNGPLFEPSFPPLAGRNLVVRAGEGYRPLLAWDAERGDGGKAPVGATRGFLSLRDGTLSLENLDVVLRWTGGGGEPVALFHVTTGGFFADGCTFSVAGKDERGIVLTRLDGGNPRGAVNRCLFRRCFARGSSLQVLDASGFGVEVLFDHCLLATGGPCLIQTEGKLNRPMTLRLVRSTLVAPRTLLRCSKVANPMVMALRCQALDCLLACSDSLTNAEMVTAAGPGNLSWQAVNCVYAGWKKLLGAGPKSIAATEAALPAWHALGTEFEADQLIAETWPRGLPAELEETAAAVYQPAKTAVAFAAVSGPGALGCPLAELPPGRERWGRLTYDRFVVDLQEMPLLTEAAAVGGADAVTVNLDKIDLGKYLLEEAKPVRGKVVLQLQGTGKRPTSPIRVKGFDLVLHFKEPEKGAEDRALTLVVSPETESREGALIEVEDGNLDLIGGRIDFENVTFAPYRYMLKVHGGNLRLWGCRLQGPLGKTPPTYQGLLALDGSATAKQPPCCTVNESVLLSGQSVVEVRGRGARVRLEQSVVVAMGDVLHLVPGSGLPKGGRLNVHVRLQQNTLALHSALIHLEDALGLSVPGEPIMVQARGNAFLDPFQETPRQSSLLRYEGQALARGLLLWQGQENAFDKRLHRYLQGGDKTPPDSQPFQLWSDLWGPQGELNPFAWDKLQPLKTFSQDDPKLERLELRPARRLSPAETLPGANLVRLGILKKTSKSSK